MELVCICCTTATAVESREAVTAFVLGIYVAELKLVNYVGTLYAFIDISDNKIRIADKLMARIQVSRRSNSQILCSRTTA